MSASNIILSNAPAKNIIPCTVSAAELQLQQGESVYNIYDMEFGQKVWPIMFSGWGFLDED